MKNLLNSTDIATLFLDKELNIRRFTNQATKIFKLIKSDIGRPFTDLVSDLIYPDLSDDALEVLRTLVFIQKQIPTRDGRWFSIRIMPYRTLDDRIDGLVITFINHSDLKHIELELHETEQMNRLLLNSSKDIIVKLSVDSRILEFNHEAEIFFGKKRTEVVNQNFFQLFFSEQFRRKSEKGVNLLVKEGQDSKVKMNVLSAGGRIKEIECSIHILYDNQKKVAGLIIMTK
jgi:two-component system CheB/CheR fusion protein